MIEYLKDKIDKNGRIKLDALDFLFDSEKIEGDSCFARNWIQLFNGDKFLLKELLTNSVYTLLIKSGNPIEEFEYNVVLIPEILKMLGVETADYFLTKYKGENLIMTPSFLKKDETLLSGNLFFDDKNDHLNVGIIIQTLKMFGFDEKLINNFIIQTFINRFIGQTDEKDSNWAIIYNKTDNTYRMSPMYDFEYTCNMNDVNRHRYVIIKDKIFNTPNSTLTGLFNYFSDNIEVINFLNKIVQNFDLEEAFERTKRNSMIDIDEEAKENYRKFFEKKLLEIKKILLKLDRVESQIKK